MEKVESKKVNRRKTAVVAVIVAVILILGVSSLVLLSKSTKKSEPSIITTSTLEKILNVSDLSTFEAIYNGVAKVVTVFALLQFHRQQTILCKAQCLVETH